MRLLGIPFRVLPPADVPESHPPGMSPVRLARTLALRKARSVSRRRPKAWVLGADTLVVAGRGPIGKPKDRQEARTVLRRLSGRTHRVMTGTVLLSPGGRVAAAAAVTTRVTFRRLGPGEMRAYSAEREPYDKAGGYALQGTAAAWVRRLEGDYFNVVGLPLGWVADRLRENGLLARRLRRRAEQVNRS